MSRRETVFTEASKLGFFDSEITQELYPLRIPARPTRPVKLDIGDGERITRYRRLYGGCVSDALHLKGVVNTVLEHQLKPLREHDVIAGRALPVKWHSLAPEIHLSRDQYEERKRAWESVGTPQKRMQQAVFPGCVLVFDTGGDQQAAVFGEMSCTLAQSHGCAGVVNAGMTRDAKYILRMENFPYFTRGTTPNAYGGWRIVDVNVPIYLRGHLTHYVIVNPGDFIFGDDDGVQIIPEDLVDEVLMKAEEIFAFEEKERELIRQGVPVDEVYRTFGDL
jgi:4-hydroxy-4-methyl-2-oxoglutarate aldolase